MSIAIHEVQFRYWTDHETKPPCWMYSVNKQRARRRKSENSFEKTVYFDRCIFPHTTICKQTRAYAVALLLNIYGIPPTCRRGNYCRQNDVDVTTCVMTWNRIVTIQSHKGVKGQLRVTATEVSCSNAVKRNHTNKTKHRDPKCKKTTIITPTTTTTTTIKPDSYDDLYIYTLTASSWLRYSMTMTLIRDKSRSTTWSISSIYRYRRFEKRWQQGPSWRVQY